MMSSYRKFEEVNAAIVDEPRNFSKAVTMLQKLRMEDDAYDATCLLLVDWREDGRRCVSPLNERVPRELSAPRFFREIIELTLMRGSPESHEAVRERLLAETAAC